MRNPGSTVDALPKVLPVEEPPADGGWRGQLPEGDHLGGDYPNGGLGELRAKLDRIDDAVHDLLMQRAEVVEQVARSGKPAALRPGREASIIRRLVRRHRGSLPSVSLFRIWRELLAGTTSMQGGFSLAVYDTDADKGLTHLAREHFGALTPLHPCDGATQALTDVSKGTASVAVLPFPSDNDTWWVELPGRQPRLYVIGRLPFWENRPQGAPLLHALVVAAAPADASADDRSFVSLECDSGISVPWLSKELAAAGLVPGATVLVREPGSGIIRVLAEVDGHLADGDARLDRLGSTLCRPVVIGGYAMPLADVP